MPINSMLHERDPADVLREAVSGVGITIPRFGVLVATYIRPTKTKTGIILTDKVRDEDKFQGKVGLVVQIGTDAFADKARFPSGPSCKVGDWVLHKFGEGTSFEINGHPCRIINDDAVRAVLDGPDGVM